MPMTENTESQKRARRLLEILQLEAVEQNLFRGNNEVHGDFRLFGGQVLAQSLRAAYHTVEDRAAHSGYGYFMRAGNAAKPVLYEVDRIRDGRSFATRSVVAIQDGEAIFSLSVSFQVAEAGFEHAHSMPNVPPPGELQDDLDYVAQLSSLSAQDSGVSPQFIRQAGRPRPFELRSVFPPGSPAWQEDRYWNPVWIRFCAPLDPSDDAQARSLLAYASDMGMVSTATLPHMKSTPRSQLQMASLDHALWIHRPVPIDGWLLFHKRTSTAHGARGLVHGEFFSEDGALIASVTQEGLVRQRRDRQPGVSA
jgi:acyl-CoA thioesterase-2